MVTVDTGAQAGATLVRNPVVASAGVFTVQLDFGANVFSGADRYLEIGVRPAGSTGAYTVLAPRQPITSSPYAIQTLNAQQLGGVDASEYVTTTSVGNTFVRNATTQQSGNFNISGIGTNTPSAKLDIAPGNGGAIRFGTPSSETGMSIQHLVGANRADVRFDGSTLKLVTIAGGGVPGSANEIAIDTSGNVGIGTTTPAHRLSISGGPFWTSNQWQGAMELTNASAIGWQANTAGNRFGIGQTNGGLLFFRTASNPGITGSPAIYDMQITDTGNITQARDKGGFYHASQRRVHSANPSLAAFSGCTCVKPLL